MNILSWIDNEKRLAKGFTVFCSDIQSWINYGGWTVSWKQDKSKQVSDTKALFNNPCCATEAQLLAERELEQIALERSASKSWSWFSSINASAASVHQRISCISASAASAPQQHQHISSISTSAHRQHQRIGSISASAASAHQRISSINASEASAHQKHQRISSNSASAASALQ